jgi:glycosyltransferase involved in cell wall biosynthesis
MLFLVYSPLAGGAIEKNLGIADYSYYFVMKRFLPLLHEFGEVKILEQAPTDEYITNLQQSQRCVYLSFTPPNRVAEVTACPVFPVFAWEYSTIPYEEFTCPEDNWVRQLRTTGRAITHSRYACDVVRSQMGQAFPIECIPAPIWDSYQRIRAARKDSPPQGLEGLSLDCTVIDTNDFMLSNTGVRPRHGTENRTRLLSLPWAGEPLSYSPGDNGGDLTLIGFNDPEPWGVWSRSGYPLLLFGFSIQGQIELSIRVRGYVQNIGKRLRIEIGSAFADLLLSENLRTHIFRMNIEQATNVMSFAGVVERAVGDSDPRDIGFGLSEIRIACLPPGALEEDNQHLDMSSDDIVSEGLFEADDQGRWTSSSQVTIMLPNSVSGDFHLAINLFFLLHNDGHEIDVYLGEQRRAITLTNDCLHYELKFTEVVTTNYIHLSGIIIGPTERNDDPRLLGLGISSISLQRAADLGRSSKTKKLMQAVHKLPAMLKSVVKIRRPKQLLYTAIFNPKDGRKNWEDIITGFVYAFREDAGSTLLVKIAYHELGELLEDIFTLLIELHPFKCRIVFIHGFLADDQYESLILHSHFVVNASRGEGQCLPLMEFMSSGVPAVAPNNSAMNEYINESNAFVVESSPEITFWPQDPRQLYRTLWQRINWESLVKAFSESARVYREKPEKYVSMSDAAVHSQENYCSMARARRGLESVLANLNRDVGQ